MSSYTPPTPRVRFTIAPARFSIRACGEEKGCGREDGEADDNRPAASQAIGECPQTQTGHGNAGCVLEVIEGEKLTWTSALGPQYRPAEMGEQRAPAKAPLSLDVLSHATRYHAAARGDVAAGVEFEDAEVTRDDG